MIIPLEVFHLIVSKCNTELKSTEDLLQSLKQQENLPEVDAIAASCGFGQVKSKHKHASSRGFILFKCVVEQQVERMALCNDYLHRLTEQ